VIIAVIATPTNNFPNHSAPGECFGEKTCLMREAITQNSSSAPLRRVPLKQKLLLPTSAEGSVKLDETLVLVAASLGEGEFGREE
jgi:hypothetical protein